MVFGIIHVLPWNVLVICNCSSIFLELLWNVPPYIPSVQCILCVNLPWADYRDPRQSWPDRWTQQRFMTSNGMVLVRCQSITNHAVFHHQVTGSHVQFNTLYYYCFPCASYHQWIHSHDESRTVTIFPDNHAVHTCLTWPSNGPEPHKSFSKNDDYFSTLTRTQIRCTVSDKTC